MFAAEDPGLANRYNTISGEHEGRIAIWCGAGEYGVHVEFEDDSSPQSDCIPYREWDRVAEFLSNRGF